MRYALICAGVMLALLLLWPLAFAPSRAVSSRPDLPATVTMAIPPAEPVVTRVSRAHRRQDPSGPSCFDRYQAAYDDCSGDEAKACRLIAIDRWDICETSGRWPR